MKLTRREFLKTALFSAGGSLLPTFPARFNLDKGVAGNAPNVIVLVLDSLSARHLSLLGYPRSTTPNLQKFAETATVYHRHYSAGNFSSPGAASILTGSYPWTHRAFQQSGLIARELVDQNLFRLVDDSYQKVAFAQNIWADLFLHQFHPSIDAHLKSTSFSIENGLRYNGFFAETDSLASFRAYDDFLEQDYGLPGSLYFSLFDKLKMYAKKEIRFSDLAEQYPRGIPNFAKYKLYFLLEDVFNGVRDEIIAAQKPFVGYFHFWTPHSPYAAKREFVGSFNDNWCPPSKPLHPLDGGVPDEQLRQPRREYDEYVANLDAEFGRFYQSLQEAGVLENSYVLVTSDHGELFERGVHGHVTPLLHDPVIHVPLIISSPGQTTRQDIYSPTSCVDILPTILKITGSYQPAHLEGSVLPGFGDNETDVPVYAIEAKKNPAFQPLTMGTFAMIQGDHKLIWYRGYPGHDDMYELYDIRNDPEELYNLCRSNPHKTHHMAKQLMQKLAEAVEN